MLSAVVPTLNAASSISECLESLRDADELIVADGGSSDETAALAQSAGAQVVVAAKGRGHQLGAGAAAASGDWLLFVHADTLPEPGWRRAVDAHIDAHPQSAGYFRLALRSPAPAARLVERAVDLRCRLLSLPYGDQGLLVPRSLYEELGGYSSIPLMEDVDLVRRIGAARLLPIAATASTSARRWEEDGWIARSGRNLACILLYRLGMAPERLARFYG